MTSRISRARVGRNARSGVSLLEVMIALAIIALIAGLAAPRLLGAFDRAKSQAASVQMANIKGALQLFYLDVGRFPSESEGLRALLVAPAGAEDWRGPYLDDERGLLDPWQRPFVYHFPGTEKAFDLMSYGRDGRAGGTNEDSDISL